MNRNDKLIVALLFLGLMAWMLYTGKQAARQSRAEQAARGALSTNAAATAAFAAATNPPPSDVPPATNTPPAAPVPAAASLDPATAPLVTANHVLPEETIELANADMELRISSRGATLRSARLPKYAANTVRGSPPVVLSFEPQPVLALTGLPHVAPDADYTLRAAPSNSVLLTLDTPQGLRVERRIALREHHRVLVADRIVNTGEIPLRVETNWVTLGTMYRGASKNGELSVDSYARKPDVKVRHWSGELPKLFGGGSMGCSGGGRLPLERADQTITGAQHWVALKSRFFVQAFAPVSSNDAFRVDALRDSVNPAAISNMAGRVAFAGARLDKGQALERSYELYIGPKKLAYLSELGGRHNEIMEFGFFSWFCKPLVSLLNFFHAIIPNYGVAIMLLTLLVRLVFWPLTHKSNESSKRMRDVQPIVKKIQEQFKDDPHKLQQEMWKVYREHKVNPFSSCLPMLVQLPVFIALYTVLRSAVELRFAPFLWVTDLSEAENLLAGVLPIPLNILPLLMAAVTILQSKLTPAMGDPMQQKMMTWMMPLMMLFFFYSMPAALSLYWTVSTVLAVLQLWLQQRTPRAEIAVGAAGGTEPMTRQMRRRMERQ